MEKTVRAKTRRIFKLRAANLLVILLCLLLTFSVIFDKVYAEVVVKGTDATKEKAQRDKIAHWLTLSLFSADEIAAGKGVTIDKDGKISVSEGGNIGAKRLRDMANDRTTSVTLKIVENDTVVDFGAWQSQDPRDPEGVTSGTQLIDITDLEHVGNVRNDYGYTPDTLLMHEITEVYEGKKGNLRYPKAHEKGKEAEIELMQAHGTSFQHGSDGTLIDDRNFARQGNVIYKKIKRPDGTFDVVKLTLGSSSKDLVKWYKEKVPCKTAINDLIAIPDPDPQVHIFSYDFNYTKNHSKIATWDSVNSHPTGAAYDKYGNLYVSENLPDHGEIRIFDLQGNLVGTITGPELYNPKGISVDEDTGDIFVAVDKRVIRYNINRTYLGWYEVPDPSFDPTGVAIWRHSIDGGLYWPGHSYDIYVSDRSGKVYQFDVNAHMNTINYTNMFGDGYLVAPEGLTIDPWGDIWVASTGNNRIYRFTLNGTLSPFGTQQFFVEDPSRKFYDIAIINYDSIYVIDETYGNGRLLLYNMNGTLTKTYGAGTLQCPESLAFYFGINATNLEPFAPPPLVSISPILASISIGESVTFTPTVDGGNPPYSGKWSISGLNPIDTPPWNLTFTPTAPGIYYVYLKVTDAANNTVQSETARITVISVPVGGYSFSIGGHATANPLTPYLALIGILTIGFTVIRRKIPRKTR